METNNTLDNTTLDEDHSRKRRKIQKNEMKYEKGNSFPHSTVNASAGEYFKPSFLEDPWRYFNEEKPKESTNTSDYNPYFKQSFLEDPWDQQLSSSSSNDYPQNRQRNPS